MGLDGVVVRRVLWGGYRCGVEVWVVEVERGNVRLEAGCENHGTYRW